MNIKYKLIALFLLFTLNSYSQKDSLNNLLFESIFNGSLELVKKLVEKGADVNARNEIRRSILMAACRRKNIDLEIITYLIDQGANINHTDKYDFNALHLALLFNSNSRVSNILIERGININAKDSKGTTPLHCSAEANNKNIAALLIKKGADIDVKDKNGYTPLFYAAECNSLETLQFLVAKGANLNALSNEGSTPMHSAGIGNADKVVSVLSKLGLDINKKDNYGNTPLHNAALNDCNKVVTVLLENKCKLGIKNKAGYTPFHLASYKNSREIVLKLIKNSANLTTKDKEGNTPLHLAAYNNSVESALLLIENEVDINTLNNYNASALDMAIIHGKMEMTDLLIKSGAHFSVNSFQKQKDSLFNALVVNSNDLKAIKTAFLLEPDLSYKNEKKNTALMVAENSGKTQIADFLRSPYKTHVLLRLGMENQALNHLKNTPNEINKADEKGQNLLHYAIAHNNLELTKYLCKKNRQLINSVDSSGETPLFEAVLLNKYDLGKKLIQYGANPNTANKSGFSPWYLASQRNDQIWLNILEKSKYKKTNLKFEPMLTISGHTNGINSVKFSPDGKYAISGSDDKTIKMWNLSNGNEIRSFIGHNCKIASVCFSPDGKYIISGGGQADNYNNSEVILWEVSTGIAIKRLTGHIHGVKSVCFSPDGHFALSAGGRIYSKRSELKIWNIKDGKLIRDFHGHSQAITSACFSPDGKKILSASEDKTIKLWNISTGKIIQNFSGHKDELKSICFSPDGKYVLSASNNYQLKKNEIILWDIKTAEVIKKITGEKYFINTICFSPDGNFILSGGGNFNNVAELLLRDLSTGNITRKFRAIKNPFNSICFSPNGKYILTGNSGRVFKNGEVELWNLKDGKVKKFRRNTKRGHTICLAPDNKKLLIGAERGYIKMIDLTTGSLIKIFNGHESSINSISCSKNGKYLLSAGGEFLTPNNIAEIKLWDINKQKPVRSFIGHTKHVSSICFSPDGKQALSGSRDKTMKLWDISTGNIIRDFIKHNDNVNSVCFSHNSKLLLSGSWDGDGAIKLWDASSGELIRSIKDDSNTGIYSVCFSPPCLSDSNGSKYFLSGSDKKRLKLWNTNTGVLIREFIGHSSIVNCVGFSPNAKLALSVDGGNEIKIWDIETGNCLQSHKNNKSFISKALFHPDGKHYWYRSDDGAVKLISLETNKEVFTILSFGEREQIFITPDKYYLCSKGVLSNLGWTIGMKTFNFEQFDLKYNRPDIVLSRLPNGDTTLIPLYYKAYQKRLKKMNIKEEMLSNEFHVPEIEITNIDSIKDLYTQNNVTLIISAKDSKYKLDRFNVWVNNIPIYGINGIDLRPVQTGGHLSITQNVSIQLSKGENKIDVSVLNQAGAESLKQTVYINYTPKEITKPNLYVVAIGISEYQNHHFNLNYAAKDANDLCSEFLKKKEQFGEIKIIKLLDKEVSLDKIKAIKETLMQSNIEDEVVVFFAGHGLLDENLDYYLALSDMNFDKPSKFGLPYEELENLLDKIPARKKLLLIDACHSGEVDKEEDNEIEIVSENTKDKVIRRGVSPLGFKKAKKKVGLKNSFELMKELFADLRRGTGAMIISSAGGGEFAFEGEQWKNGVFTYSVIQALRTSEADKNKDGIVQVSELRDFVQDMVQKLTNGKQNPTSRRENLEFDFGVW